MSDDNLSDYIDWIAHGFLTTVNGPEEQFWHFRSRLTDRRDLEGVSHHMPWNYGIRVLTIRDGPLTFRGELSQRISPHASVGFPSNLVGAAPLTGNIWFGVFFHDDMGGCDGGIPRGCFRVKILPLRRPIIRETPRKVWTLFGHVTDSRGTTPSTLMFVCDAASRQPISHEGSFDEDENALKLVERTIDPCDPSLTQCAEYVGHWVETPQSHKYTGILRRSTIRKVSSEEVTVSEEKGIVFFFQVAEIKQREEVEP